MGLMTNHMISIYFSVGIPQDRLIVLSEPPEQKWWVHFQHVFFFWKILFLVMECLNSTWNLMIGQVALGTAMRYAAIFVRDFRDPWCWMSLAATMVGSWWFLLVQVIFSRPPIVILWISSFVTFLHQGIAQLRWAWVFDHSTFGV